MTQLTKMIYIASPYTSKKLDPVEKFQEEVDRYMAITQYIGELQDQYPYAFIGPITQSHNTAMFMSNKDTTFANWEARDKTFIARCDELWVIQIDGWMESVGVRAEIKFAHEQGIPVFYFPPESMKRELKYVSDL